MEETLNHLEKVIRDVPNGSQEVEPINHIEKVIQEVGQEVIGMIPSEPKLYQHYIYINIKDSANFTTFYLNCNIITNTDTPFNYATFVSYIVNGMKLSIGGGYYDTNGKHGAVIYLTNDGTYYRVYFLSNDNNYIQQSILGSSALSFTDTVVQILGGE